MREEPGAAVDAGSGREGLKRSGLTLGPEVSEWRWFCTRFWQC